MLAIMNRFAEILKEEAQKVVDLGVGKFSRKLARRKWRAECGDMFRHRGQYFKGGGHVPSFREWSSAQI